jgi:protein TonB
VEAPVTGATSTPEASDLAAGSAGGALGISGGLENDAGSATASQDGALGAGPIVEARPSDLSAVQAGIGRTLVYPHPARRNGIQGRTVLGFILLADGSIRGLTIREGSGSAVLDRAALAAVERAAPFPAPGTDVSVVVPVVFRLQGPG